jgi:Glycosyl hydrolases family 18
MKLFAKPVILGFVAVGLLACDGTTTPGSTGRGGSTGAAGTSPGTGGGGAGSAGATGPVPGEGGVSGAAGASAGMTGAAGDGAAGSSSQPDAGLGSGGSPDAGTGSGGAGGHAGAAGGAGGATGAGGAGGKGAAGTGGKGAAGSTGAAGTTGTAGGSGNFPARVSAPYLETWNNVSLTGLATATGHKFYTLAFMISGGGCAATWNGDTALSSNKFVTDLANLRAMGGDVIISFGGASGVELGDACGTVETLQAAYQAVITKYALKWMDLDIEGGAESKTTNVDRRNKALANLKAANPGLRVAYTLAVDPSGLPQAQRNLLANAKTNGLNVDVVNVMAMDYGSCNIDMGKAATDAATATRAQLQKLGVTAAVGVTPMVGVNDTTCENFTTGNATTLVDFANGSDFVDLLAFWAVGADGSHAYLNIFKTFK